ncbi:hypothetical protein [Marinicauda sp. Alg238-R41]|uniref:hypothetical protein n=1 Tax=Marinicauda sp. Alg238-R41 TaxID=2993447 RepID=UPI0022E7BAD6|nr:hypothetical protein [Marinicauda sp. Alg238-R41]
MSQAERAFSTADNVVEFPRRQPLDFVLVVFETGEGELEVTLMPAGAAGRRVPAGLDAAALRQLLGPALPGAMRA